MALFNWLGSTKSKSEPPNITARSFAASVSGADCVLITEEEYTQLVANQRKPRKKKVPNTSAPGSAEKENSENV